MGGRKQKLRKRREVDSKIVHSDKRKMDMEGYTVCIEIYARTIFHRLT